MGCKVIWLRYSVLGFTVLVSLFFGGPAIGLFYIHIKNYFAGQTTNERFGKKARSNSITSSEMDDEDGERRQKRGCWANCSSMCCNRKVMSQ